MSTIKAATLIDKDIGAVGICVEYYDQPNVTAGEIGVIHVTPGWGDGEGAKYRGGVRVMVHHNITHPHLSGDFIQRKEEGDSVLLTLEQFDVIMNIVDEAELFPEALWHPWPELPAAVDAYRELMKEDGE